jgi:V8-like Glu-specific endopeptidase
LLALASACAPNDLVDDESNLDEDSADRDDAIIGGSAATGYPEAVLVDMKEGGQVTSLCSGALIAPKVVLTAGHCVHGFDGWNVTAPFANKQTAKASSAATYDWNNESEYVDPNLHDVGLVFLDTPITLASYPTLTSSAVATGSKVQNIGRINNGTTSYTKLFLGPAVSVQSGKQYGFPFDYATAETIQSGDSGGPVVVNGTHKIVAVNSGSGGGTQVLARVDLVSKWINDQVAAHASTTTPTTPTTPTDPCGGVTYEGKCESGKVVWCENSALQSISCSSQGKTCGYDSANHYYNCL